MAKFKPALPYTTAIELFIPTYTSSKGVKGKSYPQQGVRLNCSFKTYGGTHRSEEKDANGIIAVYDTANVETWYRPDIKPDCKIKVLQTGVEYEIINTPENIDMRNQFVKFIVQAIRGGA